MSEKRRRMKPGEPDLIVALIYALVRLLSGRDAIPWVASTKVARA
jgi:hypothetical protein